MQSAVLFAGGPGSLQILEREGVMKNFNPFRIIGEAMGMTEKDFNSPSKRFSRKAIRQFEKEQAKIKESGIGVHCDCGWNGDVTELIPDDPDSSTSTLRCPQCTSSGWIYD
jgi:hypothetical protein